MSRVDGHHENISRAMALAQRFFCSDCGEVTEPGDVKILHRQYGGGTPILRLADTLAYDPISEDEARCGNCGSASLTLIDADGQPVGG